LSQYGYMTKASKNRGAERRHALDVTQQGLADQLTKAIQNLAEPLTKPSKNRIAEVRKARGMTQQELADQVGAHWITISKLERGIIKLTTEWMEKLARPLGVHPGGLLAVPFLFSADETKLPPEPGVAEGTGRLIRELGGRRITVQDDAYEPFLHRGDQVDLEALSEVAAKDRQSLEGGLCVFENGKVTRFGFLYLGKRAGSFDLFWLGQRVIQGAKTSEISLVSSIRFKARY
jgi:transcriptional regulator with XRE-family HTH domain